MTEPHDLDELASALLDGTTSPEETAQLAEDAVLRAQVESRAEELRAVRRALTELPPVDAARREAAITAGLAAFDQEAVPGDGASVTPLAPRRRMSPLAVGALSAAAVLVLIALLVPLLTDIGHDDETATFSSTGAAIEESAGDAAEAPAASSTSGAPELSAGADAARTTLGSFDDLDALAAAVATGQLGSSKTASSTDFQGQSCVPDPEPGSVAGLAVVAGRLVEVDVTTEPDGTRTMTVRASNTCELLDRREL